MLFGSCIASAKAFAPWFCCPMVQARMLALTNHTGVPVSCGSEDPLVGDNAPPAEWMTTIETVEALGLPEGGDVVDIDSQSRHLPSLPSSGPPWVGGSAYTRER